MVGETWSIPRIWPDSTVVVVGGGPSLADTDLSLLESNKVRVVGVNNAYTLGTWVDTCWFGDSRWYLQHRKALLDWSGIKVTCATSLLRRRKNTPTHPPGVHVVRRSKKSFGIDPDPSRVAWNKSSGASAINYAYHLGAKRIVLVGFDMQVGASGQHNWHTDHERTPPTDVYQKRFLQAFSHIERDLTDLGVDIVNASPVTAIDVIFRMPLREALNGYMGDSDD